MIGTYEFAVLTVGPNRVLDAPVAAVRNWMLPFDETLTELKVLFQNTKSNPNGT